MPGLDTCSFNAIHPVAQAQPANDNPLTCLNSLKRCRNRGVQVQTIIDAGASNGSWSMRAKRLWPDAHCLLIEAKDCWRSQLSQLALGRRDIEYVIAAASDKPGTVDIHHNPADPYDGQVDAPDAGGTVESVPATTVDDEVRLRGLSGQFLLNLDTHGYERPIFDGAAETLKQTSLIVVECYNFNISPTCLRFHEIIAYLETKGFRCVDMCNPMWRPLDGALWQMDLVFARADYAGFKSNEFQI